VLAVIAAAALVAPLSLVALAALALLVATLVDAWSVRKPPEVHRAIPHVLSRGVATRVQIEAQAPSAARVRVRQATPPALALAPAQGTGRLECELEPRVRGRHVLPELGTRAEGRLGLGAYHRQAGGSAEVHVYPDLVAARRLAVAAREGRLLDSTRRARGPLGTGTDFESVREWVPDDDVRHVNWAATLRVGRPMTNQYRLEQDRELVFLVDAGRLMAAPLNGRTRLDAALDAVAAVALAADELGDHSGAVAFDAHVRAQLRPRRGGGAGVVRALFDLQPRLVDSDYDLAFRKVAGGKRSLVLVLTDLFDDDAARSLVEAVPVLTRRHVVLAASVTDPDLVKMVSTPPAIPSDVYSAAAALELLDGRARAAARLRGAGARVVEATPDAFSAACVRAYLGAKARLRL
jgi:uncharacterized protein (DUF58 family)